MVRFSGTPLAVLSIAAGLVVAVVAACGSKPTSDVPVAVGPGGPVGPPPGGKNRGSRRQVLVGQMCPAAAAGRPAIRPLFLRRESWTDDAAALVRPVERREARQFSVLGWDGRRAGLFSVAGAATTESGIAAIGAYAGHSPCERRRGVASAGRDPECEAVLRDCGLAASVLEAAGGFEARPLEEDPEPAAFESGGACIAGDRLVVDIDRDGVAEAYPAAGFTAASGAGDEIMSVDAGGAACAPRFAFRAPAGASGAPGMDVLGVIDLDGDGRHEIVALLHGGGRQVLAMYSAVSVAARLERVGVGTPWPSAPVR